MSKEIPFEKSFASSDKAKYWSDKNELKPEQVALQSNKKFWFNCSCGHEFEKILSTIIKNTWCSYCCIPIIKLCSDNACIQCFNNSFASCEKSKLWSYKNDIQPRNISKKCGVKNLINQNNKVLYSVPYQHFTNSIENYFSMFKSRLSKLDGLTYNELKVNINKVINNISQEKFLNIFKGAYNRK
jgi:hypothetical protein